MRLGAPTPPIASVPSLSDIYSVSWSPHGPSMGSSALYLLVPEIPLGLFPAPTSGLCICWACCSPNSQHLSVHSETEVHFLPRQGPSLPPLLSTPPPTSSRMLSSVLYEALHDRAPVSLSCMRGCARNHVTHRILLG